MLWYYIINASPSWCQHALSRCRSLRIKLIFLKKDPSLFKSIKLRFSKPVLPGDTLIIKMWNEGNGQIIFTTSVKSTGAVVINNAVFQMKTGAKM